MKKEFCDYCKNEIKNEEKGYFQFGIPQYKDDNETDKDDPISMAKIILGMRKEGCYDGTIKQIIVCPQCFIDIYKKVFYKFIWEDKNIIWKG